MKEEELKRRAKKRRVIPEESWAYLLDRGYVEDALSRPLDEEMVEYIIKQFDDLAAASPRTGSRKQTVDQERKAMPVSLSESELQRKGAFEEYVAMCAACDDGTRRFRNRVLGNRALTAEQARELIRSLAARFFEADSFEFGGGNIPLLGHHATLEAYERERGRGWEVWHRATISVDPPGLTKTVEKSSYEMPQLAIESPGNMDGGDGQALHFLKERSPARKIDGGDSQALYFVNEGGRARKLWVWSWSLLEQLRSLCEQLAQRYRWELAQATMFVLTGEIPAVPALKVTKSFRFSELHLDATTRTEHLDATINLTASAWVPSNSVARAYRKAQTKILGGSGGRPPSLKNLSLFRFVTERIQPLSELATQERASRIPVQTKKREGKRLVREWNKAYPQWAYKTRVGDLNTRQFWRDYDRIKNTIAIGPPYQRPERFRAQ